MGMEATNVWVWEVGVFFFLSYINCFLDLPNAFSLKEKTQASSYSINSTQPDPYPYPPSKKKKEN